MHGDERFGETAWSVVLAAGNASEPRASQALSHLCQIYWPAIYGYLRRRGYSRDDAQDLTQSFFQHIVQEQTLRRAFPERGRFRSFLLGALTRCLADERARLDTIKRGAGAQFVSIDEVAAEELYHQRLASEIGPAESLDARWAGIVLERALAKVRSELVAEGKAKTFDALVPFLAGDKPDLTYEEAARRLGVGLGAVKTAIYRLRRQFAGAVRREILQTVSAPHEVDEELRELRAVFSRMAHQPAL